MDEPIIVPIHSTNIIMTTIKVRTPSPPKMEPIGARRIPKKRAMGDIIILPIIPPQILPFVLYLLIK